MTSAGYRRPRRRRRWPWLAGALAAIVAAAAAFAFFAWPRGALTLDADALARLSAPSFGARGTTVSARTAAGAALRTVLHTDGRIWPTRQVAPGTRIVVTVVVNRPGWIGWLAGRTQRVRLEVSAPVVKLRHQYVRVAPGAPLRVRFDGPVRKLELRQGRERRLRRLAKPSATVALGRVGLAGSAGVAAVARSWERLPRPTTVTWFPPGRTARLLASPKPGSRLRPRTPLVLTFSEPIGAVLHGREPLLRPQTPGRWRTLDSHTLQFVPAGYGYGLDTAVHVTLPAPVERIGGSGRATRALSWSTPSGTQLRLQQLLAELGYLPVVWTPAAADAGRTISAQVAAAEQPPAGRFDWRYPDTPPELTALWSPGQPNTIVRGAVMTFQDTHHLTVDGFAGADVWRALIADALAGKRHDSGYSYVYVHRSVPQSLNLWHDGAVILSSPGNTGVPAAPTQLGTFPVFEHIPIGTMSGTNPDGSHYDDPGIRYISYFNGGDAIHAFNRASFGTPQSLGCVELPLDAAARVWPYTPIGTLVTIED
jgi:hypothetical protein